MYFSNDFWPLARLGRKCICVQYLAGLKALRDSRDFRNQMADRLASLDGGRAFVLEGGRSAREFLDSIDSEVDAELPANLWQVS
jgi:hypothetical protein